MNPMASERQREANRRNGRAGGPKTGEGKQNSRSNSLKHGLTSSTLVVLPEEDRQEYEHLISAFRDSLQPHGAVEDALVLRLAQAHWRSLRSRCVETGMLNVTAASQRNLAQQLVDDCPENLNPHHAIGVGFLVMPPERWHTYLRYDTTISRDFFRTLDTLTRLQRSRRQAPVPTDPQPAVYAAGSAAQLSDNGIRFVSQNRTPSDLAPSVNTEEGSR